LNSSVFSWRRNVKYVDDILTDEGNAFQASAVATGKARSPRVARRVDGTSSVDNAEHAPVFRDPDDRVEGQRS